MKYLVKIEKHSQSESVKPTELATVEIGMYSASDDGWYGNYRITISQPNKDQWCTRIKRIPRWRGTPYLLSKVFQKLEEVEL